jgi:hypothetical protein
MLQERLLKGAACTSWQRLVRALRGLSRRRESWNGNHQVCCEPKVQPSAAA